MKRFYPVTLALLLSSAFAFAITHQAQLTWTAPSDANANSAYNVYRANATCPSSGIGTLTWTKLTATPQTALTYTDLTVTPGSWCYYVTQTQGTAESGPSNTAGGNVLPSSPSITIVIN
jgi:hypothetical protein